MAEKESEPFKEGVHDVVLDSEVDDQLRLLDPDEEAEFEDPAGFKDLGVPEPATAPVTVPADMKKLTKGFLHRWLGRKNKEMSATLMVVTPSSQIYSGSGGPFVLSDGVFSWKQCYVDMRFVEKLKSDLSRKEKESKAQEATNSGRKRCASPSQLFGQSFPKSLPGFGVQRSKGDESSTTGHLGDMRPAVYVKKFESMSFVDKNSFMIREFEVLDTMFEYHEDAITAHSGTPADYNEQVRKQMLLNWHKLQKRDQRQNLGTVSWDTHFSRRRSGKKSFDACLNCSLSGHYRKECPLKCIMCNVYTGAECYATMSCNLADYFLGENVSSQAKQLISTGNVFPGEIPRKQVYYGAFVMDFTKYLIANKQLGQIQEAINSDTGRTELKDVLICRVFVSTHAEGDTSEPKSMRTIEHRNIYRAFCILDKREQSGDAMAILKRCINDTSEMEYATSQTGTQSQISFVTNNFPFSIAVDEEFKHDVPWGTKNDLPDHMFIFAFLKQDEKRGLKTADWPCITVHEAMGRNSRVDKRSVWIRPVENLNLTDRIDRGTEIALRKMEFVKKDPEYGLRIHDDTINRYAWNVPVPLIKRFLRGQMIPQPEAPSITGLGSKTDLLQLFMEKGAVLLDNFQKFGVHKILRGGINCVQGAPGTGKTNVLLMSAVMAVLEGKCVLIATSSNAIADNLTIRLLELITDLKKVKTDLGITTSKQVWRLIRGKLKLEDQPEKIRWHSARKLDALKLPFAKICITTVGAAGGTSLFGTWVPNYIMIDEASMISVTEFLSMLFHELPLENAKMEAKQGIIYGITIAGDCQQLPSHSVRASIIRLAENHGIQSTTLLLHNEKSPREIVFNYASDALSEISNILDIPLQSLAIANCKWGERVAQDQRSHRGVQQDFRVISDVVELKHCYRGDSNLYAAIIHLFYKNVTYVPSERDKSPFLSISRHYNATHHIVNCNGSHNDREKVSVHGINLQQAARHMRLKEEHYSIEEAEVLVGHLLQLIESLGRQNDLSKEFLVLSPYTDQCKLIKYLLGAVAQEARIRAVRVMSIDKAQGSEAKIVLLSLGRHNGYLGFLKNENDPVLLTSMNGRMCTALSRMTTGMMTYMNADAYHVEEAVAEKEALYGYVSFMAKKNLIIPPAQPARKLD